MTDHHDPINLDLRGVRGLFEHRRRDQERIGNVDRIAEGIRRGQNRLASGEGAGTQLTAWFFGLVGALAGGVIQPFGAH